VRGPVRKGRGAWKCDSMHARLDVTLQERGASSPVGLTALRLSCPAKAYVPKSCGRDGCHVRAATSGARGMSAGHIMIARGASAPDRSRAGPASVSS
jgi:hypothetical protein